MKKNIKKVKQIYFLFLVIYIIKFKGKSPIKKIIKIIRHPKKL